MIAISNTAPLTRPRIWTVRSRGHDVGPVRHRRPGRRGTTPLRRRGRCLPHSAPDEWRRSQLVQHRHQRRRHCRLARARARVAGMEPLGPLIRHHARPRDHARATPMVCGVSCSTLWPRSTGPVGTAAVHQAMDSIQRLLGGCAARRSVPPPIRPWRETSETSSSRSKPTRTESVVTDPNTGMAHPISITGRDVDRGRRDPLSNPSLIPLFPRSSASSRPVSTDRRRLASMLVTPGLDASDGMALSVMCADRGRIDVQSGLRRLLAAHPEYEAVGTRHHRRLPGLASPAGPALVQPAVASAIPTLVLAGEWDSSTPAKLARDAATHLCGRPSSNSRPRSRGSEAHQPLRAVTASKPSSQPSPPPDTTCVEQLPEPAWN